MRYIALAAMLLAYAAPVSAEKICESCILRQASHKDDLTKVRYYEDTDHFNSNLREGTPTEEPDESGVTWINQKEPKKLKRKAQQK